MYIISALLCRSISFFQDNDWLFFNKDTGVPGVLQALMQAWRATVDKALEYGVIILRTDAVLVA